MKDIETVHIDWRSIASIERAERKKAMLENAGYILKNTTGRFDVFDMHYHRT